MLSERTGSHNVICRVPRNAAYGFDEARVFDDLMDLPVSSSQTYLFVMGEVNLTSWNLLSRRDDKTTFLGWISLFTGQSLLMCPLLPCAAWITFAGHYALVYDAVWSRDDSEVLTDSAQAQSKKWPLWENLSMKQPLKNSINRVTAITWSTLPSCREFAPSSPPLGRH